MTYNPAIHHRRSIRLKGYDYSQTGLYFITICTKNRGHVFGEICDNGKGAMICALNKYGEIVNNEWMKTSKIRSNVGLNAFMIMPNHLHGIIINESRGDDIDHGGIICRRGVSPYDPTEAMKNEK